MYKLLLISLALIASPALNAQAMCHYNTYKWNTHSKKAVNFKRISKPYSQLERREVDIMTGCSVCEEDQVTITLSDVKPFKVCKHMAQRFQRALLDSLAAGEPIISVTGYRVGMTRGEPDNAGNRTGFSNHSFGIAIDINEQHNGLYGNCIAFGPHCQLRRGGKWQVGQQGSLSKSGATVRAMEAVGLKWGGEIAGQQKDFMHFSPSGY